MAFCSVEPFSSTKRTGVICFTIAYPPPYQQNQQLAVRGRNEFIYFALDRKVHVGSCKKGMDAQTSYLAHSSMDLFALPLYCAETPHIHTHVLLRAFFSFHCVWAWKLGRWRLFFSGRVRDWMECSLQVDQSSIAWMQGLIVRPCGVYNQSTIVAGWRIDLQCGEAWIKWCMIEYLLDKIGRAHV